MGVYISRYYIQSAQWHAPQWLHPDLLAVNRHFMRDRVNVYRRHNIIEKHVFLTNAARLSHGLELSIAL